MGILDNVKGAARAAARFARAPSIPGMPRLAGDLNGVNPLRRRRKQPSTKTPEPQTPKVPTCSCGKELDWRDAQYGRKGLCKRCTRQEQENALRGHFIPAHEYVALLAKRGKPETAKPAPATVATTITLNRQTRRRLTQQITRSQQHTAKWGPRKAA